MTWANYIATGSGKTAFRIAIEGVAYEFVTDTEMRRLLSGSTTGRVVGLLRESLQGGERVHPGTAELEQDVVNVRIVDVLGAQGTGGDAVTKALAYRPSVTTWLTAEASVSDTNIDVSSTVGITAGDVVHIGTEAMGVSVVVDSNTLTVARGLHGSTAQRHVLGTGDTRANPQVTNRPIFLEGRRVRLYAYGEGDSPTGNGTQIWLGVCQSDARLDQDGATWEIQVAGIWQITEQDLGADLAKPRRPRGIYYPWSAPLVIYLGQGSSANPRSADTYSVELLIVGFWETQDEFVDALNTELAAADATAFPSGGTLRAVSTGNGEHWHFVYRTSGTARWPYIRTFSTIDVGIDSAHPPNGTAVPEGIGTVAINTNYYLHPPWSLIAEELRQSGKGTVPRGALGGADTRFASTATQLDWPSGVVPLDGDLSSLDAGPGTTQMHATAADGTVIDGLVPYLEMMAAPAGGPPSIDDYGNWIQLDPSNAATTENALEPVGFNLSWTSTRLPEFRFVRTFLESGNVGGLQAALVLDAAELGNTGTWPFVTSDDLDAWATEAAAAARGRQVVSKRVFAASEGASLRELLTHEFRLLGVYPVVTSTGKIDIQAVRTPASTEPTVGSLDASTILVDRQRPTWERNTLGSINTVRHLTGWNPRENEHQGRTILVRDVGAYSLRKATRELEVAPRSAVVGGDASVSVADYVELAQPVLGLFGRDYAVVDIEAPMTAWPLGLGDLISITTNLLPNWNAGTRGVEGEVGFVIGRSWDLNRGRIRLRIILSTTRVAGYTPTLTITSKASGSDGTTGPFVFNWSSEDPLGNGSYIAAGDTPAAHWDHASLRAQIVQWDATSPTRRTGTITAFTTSTATTGTLTITFDSNFAGLSTSLWTMRFPTSTTTSLLERQSRYAFLARTAARIEFSTLPDITAYEYAA